MESRPVASRGAARTLLPDIQFRGRRQLRRCCVSLHGRGRRPLLRPLRATRPKSRGGFRPRSPLPQAGLRPRRRPLVEHGDGASCPPARPRCRLPDVVDRGPGSACLRHPAPRSMPTCGPPPSSRPGRYLRNGKSRRRYSATGVEGVWGADPPPRRPVMPRNTNAPAIMFGREACGVHGQEKRKEWLFSSSGIQNWSVRSPISCWSHPAGGMPAQARTTPPAKGGGGGK